METTLLLVRHGETDQNKKRVYMGRSGDPLNEKGRGQAEAIAERLSSIGITRIFSSPVARAVQTAEAIAGKAGIDVETLDNFTEIDFGPWQKLTAEVIEKRWPRAWRLWKQTPHLLDFSGIETLTGVRMRVEEGLNIVLDECGGGKVAIVTHDVVVRILVSIALGIDNSHYRSFAVGNAALSVITFEGERGRIDLLNDTCHRKIPLNRREAG